MCAPCKHKQQAAARAAMRSHPAMQATIPQSNTTVLEGIAFQTVYYVGANQDDIPSTLSRVSYKKKNFGDQMYVAQQDLEAFPHLWTESLPDE
jgi:hypothetical protein